MIEESLLKTGILGKDGFVWWIGRVAHERYWKDVNVVLSQDGKTAQRCKVRIIGYHPFDNTLKEEELPWAHVLMDPITGSGQGGGGTTMTLRGGETCVGFFLDGEDGQQPVIIGLLHRSEDVQNSITEEEIFTEQSSKFKPFTGHPGNIIEPTKRQAVTTNPVEQGTTGSIDVGVTTSKGEPSVHIKKANASAAQAAFEKKTTKTWRNPSKCGDDFIGRLTQIIQDFIAFVDGLESAVGQFIDPILNEIVNITNQIRQVANQIGGIIKQIINNIRSGIVKCLISLFKKFLGIQKKTNPADFVLAPAAQKATKNIIDVLFCIFENLIDEIIDFVVRMLENLLGKVINGPACAAEQFVSGMMSKVMELIEDAISPVLSGISWLTGGLSNITKVLSDVSNLATQIYNFIGCDGLKCDTPSEWISSTSAALKKSSDDWGKQVRQINVLKSVSNDLSRVSGSLNEGFFIDERPTYNNSILTNLFRSIDNLSGGNLSEVNNNGFGSIESAIARISLYGDGAFEFDECNQRLYNPQSQDDLIRMPIGYRYGTGLPPKVEVYGNGTGADLTPIVGDDTRIFSIEVNNGGSGYDDQTTVAVIDNSGYGSGAQAIPVINNGSIERVILTSFGFGYIGGSQGTSSGIVGTVSDIFIKNPGFGYDPNDTIGIGNTIASIVTTPNGSIVSVQIPTNYNQQFAQRPILIINTSTGIGANLIPVMRYKQQFTSDREQRPLVGITSVIDCI